MTKFQSFNELAKKNKHLNTHAKKPQEMPVKVKTVEPTIKPSSGIKFNNGFAIILLAVVVSGSIPFVQAHFANNDETSISTVNQETKQALAPLENMEAFVWAARLKIEDLKLHHRLKLDSNSQNNIEVLGNVSLQEKAQWEEFIAWYDTKSTFPKLSHNVTATAISGNVPKLRSVWFNENPMAYFQDGSFGKVGAVLQDGWTITNIEAWAVLLERDGAMITLSYQ